MKFIVYSRLRQTNKPSTFLFFSLSLITFPPCPSLFFFSQCSLHLSLSAEPYITPSHYIYSYSIATAQDRGDTHVRVIFGGNYIQVSADGPCQVTFGKLIFSPEAQLLGVMFSYREMALKALKISTPPSPGPPGASTVLLVQLKITAHHCKTSCVSGLSWCGDCINDTISLANGRVRFTVTVLVTADL